MPPDSSFRINDIILMEMKPWIKGIILDIKSFTTVEPYRVRLMRRKNNLMWSDLFPEDDKLIARKIL